MPLLGGQSKNMNQTILILFGFTFIISCSSLDHQTSSGDKEASCITLKPHFSCPLEPLKDIGIFVRQFERIKHKYELSLIDGSTYNLISKLQVLYKELNQQAEVFDYNLQIITAKVDNYNNIWARNPREGNWLRIKIIEYQNYAPRFKDMKHNLSMLIEKLKAIKKHSNKWKSQKEKGDKTLKALKVYSI